jgi:hypothetical protein
MASIKIGWTEPLVVARLHADPSGVQEASTTLQALLLPGMSTQTPRLRYISLFAAARYYRMEAGASADAQLSLSEYLRRLEALIAVSSVRHHIHDNAQPDGIIGRGAGRRMSQEQEFKLKTGLQNPPYNIYRGTLSNLGIFDTSTMSDPLFDHAKSLATAWDLKVAGTIGEDMKRGILPDLMTCETVDKIASAFCLCNIPERSTEQRELIRILFAQQKELHLSDTFRDEETLASYSQTYRSLAWRFLLELVFNSGGNHLVNHYTLVYILTHDFARLTENPALRLSLQTWRWIAARTFFERGWTQIFAQTINVLKQASYGLSSKDLQHKLQEDYLAIHEDKPINSLREEVEKNYLSSDWLIERFEGKQYRDFLLCICIGMLIADNDKHTNAVPILEKLWERGPIPFSHEYIRFESSILNDGREHLLWTKFAEESLIQHTHIALRKMSDGNPDSLLVDFDAGQWKIPEKALNVIPTSADGFTRLDIALRWGQQLGLVEATSTRGFTLTELGLDCCIEWDQEHR